MRNYSYFVSGDFCFSLITDIDFDQGSSGGRWRRTGGLPGYWASPLQDNALITYSGVTRHSVTPVTTLQLNTVEMEASEVDWETINDQLPYDHSEESHARRREIWNGMNVNGNKFLSLAEVDKGIIDVRNVWQHN